MAAGLSHWLRRSRAPVVAVLVASLSASVFEGAFATLKGPPLSIGYLATCTGLSLLLAAVVGAVGGAVTPRPAFALALWMAAHGYLVRGSLVLAAGLGAAGALLALLPARDGSKAPVRSGVAAALALCVTFVVWPKLGPRLGIGIGTVYRDSVSVAVAAGVLLAHAGYARARGWLPRSPGETALSIAALALVLAAIPVYLARRDEGSGGRFVERPAESGLPTVILLVLDTVRADHLSIHGYARDTTPALARFLADHPRAVSYPLAFSTSPWTIPAHASLFTGELPSSHGAHSANLENYIFSSAAITADATLAEVMAARGYRTGGVFANGNVTVVTGMERGFDVYRTPPRALPLTLIGEPLRAALMPLAFAAEVTPAPRVDHINAELLELLASCAPGPCFLVANYMDAHSPYLPAAPHDQRFAPAGHTGRVIVGPFHDDEPEMLALLMARYDESIRTLDAGLGALLDELERRDLLDTAWLFITADHGEAFAEHGVAYHGTGIHNDQVRIPLIVHPPRGVSLPPRADAVDLLDVTATISAIAGAPPLGRGRDLRDPDAPARPVQVESFGHAGRGYSERFGGALAKVYKRAVVVGSEKLIEIGERRELYDLRKDPLETRDRITEDGEEARALGEVLPPLDPGTGGAGRGRELSSDELQRLRALGYAK